MSSGARRWRPTRRELLAGLGGAAAVAAVGGSWQLAGARAPQAPSYTLLTFRRGTLTGASFAGTDTVVYSAAWEGGPSEVYSALIANPVSRPLGFSNATVLSLSKRGELALLLSPQASVGNSIGTLARVPLGGGAPRRLLEGARGGDWGPDGESLCAWSETEGGRLEYPLGRVLAHGDLQFPRVSPRGDVVAFQGDDGVELVDLHGRRTVLSGKTSPPFQFGLAWAPSGDEIWFTGGPNGTDRGLWAVDLTGRERLVARVAGSVTILEAGANGTALLAAGYGHWEIVGVTAGGVERQLAVFTRSNGVGISADGGRLLVQDFTHGDQVRNAGMYVRAMDSSPAVDLGIGWPLALSPEGERVFCFIGTPAHLVELPVGAGEPREISRVGLPLDGRVAGASFGAWSADGKSLFLAAGPTPSAARVFLLGKTGTWRPVTPPGVGLFTVSPDGRWVAARPAGGQLTLFPTDDGAPRSLGGESGEPLHWGSDGRTLFLRDNPGHVTAVVSRLDVVSGTRSSWRTISPAEPTGVALVNSVLIAGNGEAYSFSCSRVLNDLYLVDGLS